LSWKLLARPVLFCLPAEAAHHAAMNAFSRMAALPTAAARLRRKYCICDTRLEVEIFSIRFPNPVGLAAGFDKDGRWYPQLATLGFGSIEIGTVTGQAQPGNPKPRLFRLPADKALINRMGFNSSGCNAVAATLAAQRKRGDFNGVLGINIGKSRAVPLADASTEYQKSFERLHDFADYFTINVSAPNTPNLRELQDPEHLVAIIQAIRTSNDLLSNEKQIEPKPILLKIAPDLTDKQLNEIAEVAREHQLSGVIATNTTLARNGLKTPAVKVGAMGAGGLSGQPLHARSLQIISRLYRCFKGEIPIVGVGGIMNGMDAWNMITAGANLVQLYTGFIYGGPGIVREINLELLRHLKINNMDHISEAVGIHASMTSSSA